jgi:hypothetical protein
MVGGAGGVDADVRVAKRKRFFFEKKKQNTFAPDGRRVIPPLEPDFARQ